MYLPITARFRTVFSLKVPLHMKSYTIKSFQVSISTHFCCYFHIGCRHYDVTDKIHQQTVVTLCHMIRTHWVFTNARNHVRNYSLNIPSLMFSRSHLLGITLITTPESLSLTLTLSLSLSLSPSFPLFILYFIIHLQIITWNHIRNHKQNNYLWISFSLSLSFSLLLSFFTPL